MRIGDTVFIRTGTPATVKERDDITGKLTLETDPEKVHQEMRHGYLNGLEPDQRKELYEILDEVKGETSDPAQKVDQMAAKITELEQDPRKFMLTKYLRAEMVHLMNTYDIRPKQYSINESKAR